MKTTLKQLSVCSCGFPALDEKIQLGTEYDIEPGKVKSYHWTCGGCKDQFYLLCVFVHPRGESHGGYLPLDLFDLTPEAKGLTE